MRSMILKQMAVKISTESEDLENTTDAAATPPKEGEENPAPAETPAVTTSEVPTETPAETPAPAEENPAEAAPVEATPEAPPVAPAEADVAATATAEAPTEPATETPAEVPAEAPTEGETAPVAEAPVPAAEEPTAESTDTLDEIEQIVPPADAPDTLETDIVNTDEEMNAAQADTQVVAAVTEAMESFKDEVARMVANKECTPATLRLLQVSMEHHVARLGEPVAALVTESLTSESIERQHELAVEGVFANMAQSMVVHTKHHYNAMTDFFRTTKSRIARYKESVQEAEDEFKKNKDSYPHGTIDGSLNDLWYFFSIEKNDAGNFMSILKKDVEMSRYVLDTYSHEVLKNMQRIVDVVKNTKIQSIADVQKLASAIEAIPHPFTLFKRDIAGGTYFNKTTFAEQTSNATKALEVGGKHYDKLAALATDRYWVEQGSFGHKAKKVGAYVGTAVMPTALTPIGATVAGAALTFATPQLKLKVDDIAKVIEAGKQYIANAEKYLALENEVRQVCEVWEDVGVIDGSALSKEEQEVLRRINKQIDRAFWNALFSNFARPARSELARAIRGAKYCGYFSKRMLYNAK